MQDYTLDKKDFFYRYIAPWVPNTSFDEVLDTLDTEILARLFYPLLFPKIERPEIFFRRLCDYALRYMEDRFRLQITSILKRIRNPNLKIKILFPYQALFNAYLFGLRKSYGAIYSTWKGKRAAVCLSHDIDTREGYQYASRLLAIDEAKGIPSVFNIVTHGSYYPEDSFIRGVGMAGFEIGLHGYRHEIGLAGKPQDTLRRELELAIDFLRNAGADVKGFRSPGFSISEVILDILYEVGLIYDSSMQVCNGHYQSCGLSFPYRYPGKDIWEFPLTRHDDLFFRDSNTREGEALITLEKILVQIIEIGGMASFNFHPCLMKDRELFYKSFLNMLKDYANEVWFVLPGELCDWLEHKTDVEQ